MEPKKVAVLFGGVSSEHEVSRLTAASVLKNLDRALWEPVPVGITKEGRWLLYRGPVEAIPDGSWEKDPGCVPAVLSPDRGHRGLLMENGERIEVDVVFPALHGKNGEDGTVQGLAALAGIPCVGCGVLSSALCMDKDMTKRVLADHGIPHAPGFSVTPEDRDDAALAERIPKTLGWPVFVKPACAGSSVGVSRVEGPEELPAALDTAFREDRKVIIEEAIQGAEVECAVMGNFTDIFVAQSLGEIVPKRGLYDYEGKYLDGSTDLYIPARISQRQAEVIRETALKAYRVLGCTGLARVDFFVTKYECILNEVNTLPGFTDISMYPKLMMASEMSYAELLTRLLRLAVELGGQ